MKAALCDSKVVLIVDDCDFMANRTCWNAFGFEREVKKEKSRSRLWGREGKTPRSAANFHGHHAGMWVKTPGSYCSFLLLLPVSLRFWTSQSCVTRRGWYSHRFSFPIAFPKHPSPFHPTSSSRLMRKSMHFLWL